MSRPVSRDLAKHDPAETPTRWWCSECRTYVDGPWHDRACPMQDDAS